MKGYRHTEAAKQKIGRGARRAAARRRAAGTVALADVRRLEATGTCAPSLRPFLPVVRSVYLDLLEDQGGADQVSTARKALLDSHSRLHLVELALGLRIAQEPADLEAMARLTAIVDSRRSLLVTLGLERVARDVIPSLASYVTERSEDRAGATNGAAPGSEAQ